MLDARDSGEPVSWAFAIHQSPSIPSGLIATKGGALLASADVVRITLRGKGGHASKPHDANDPVPVACAIVGALQTWVTRRVDVFTPAVITIGRIRAGTHRPSRTRPPFAVKTMSGRPGCGGMSWIAAPTVSASKV